MNKEIMTEIDFVMSSVEALKGSPEQFGMRSSFLLAFHDAFLAQSVKSRYYKARGREFDPGLAPKHLLRAL